MIKLFSRKHGEQKIPHILLYFQKWHKQFAISHYKDIQKLALWQSITAISETEASVYEKKELFFER